MLPRVVSRQSQAKKKSVFCPIHYCYPHQFVWHLTTPKSFTIWCSFGPRRKWHVADATSPPSSPRWRRHSKARHRLPLFLALVRFIVADGMAARDGPPVLGHLRPSIVSLASPRRRPSGASQRSAYPSSHTTHEAQGVAGDEFLGVSGAARGTGGRPCQVSARRVEAGRARRPARRPKLLQLSAQLLARRRPVGDDVVPQVLDMTLQVQFILLEPADIELLPRCSALELPGNVFLVVADDSGR